MKQWSWLVWRELAVIARTPPFWAAAAAQAALLAAFLLAWGEGLPTIAGNVFEQLTSLHLTLLAVLLPWVAARCGGEPRGEVTRTAAAFGIAPSRLLWARAIGLLGASGLLAASALPMWLLAQQIAALPPASVAGVLLPAVSMLAFVAICTTWTRVLLEDRVAAWVAVTALTLLVRVGTAGAGQLAAFALAAAAGAVLVGARGDRMLRYLPERVRPGAHV